MPYSYITTGNDYHREPTLSGLDEQPLDNDTKEVHLPLYEARREAASRGCEASRTVR